MTEPFSTCELRIAARVVGHEAVEASGGRVALIDLVEGKSTTGTIERLRSP